MRFDSRELGLRDQFAQLAAVHVPWYHQEETRDPSRAGCRATFVGKLDAGNFHMMLRSRLFTRQPLLVPVQTNCHGSDGTGRAAIDHAASLG